MPLYARLANRSSPTPSKPSVVQSAPWSPSRSSVAYFKHVTGARPLIHKTVENAALIKSSTLSTHEYGSSGFRRS